MISLLLDVSCDYYHNGSTEIKNHGTEDKYLSITYFITLSNTRKSFLMLNFINLNIYVSEVLIIITKSRTLSVKFLLNCK